ncbi:MAG TPA: ATP-binding protein [Tahibacter sp.]|uniref:hybrid sensor histidine kinase/response regulator n=1 Tax=Tahibacter sp. TaxID=2056211 RepID=UPI002C4D9C19|nr:ATP-binding protein [Tahibacter sp.]HSX61856.1 ATP-binding protein [Tahibacter sp.]
MHRTAPEGHRILVCAPYGSDATHVAQLLREGGYDGWTCAGLDEIAGALDDHTGAVLVTEDGVRGNLAPLRQALARQPPWSDVPFILLAARQSSWVYGPPHRARELSELASNVIVLERPLSSRSLLSSIDTALRSRQRQFAMRDQLADIAQSRDALAQSREALAASEAELRRVADALPVFIGFIDSDYRYRFANRAYEDWIYRTPASVIGLRIEDVVGAAVFAERKPFMDRALRGEDMLMQVSWPHRDGRRREAEVRYLPRRTESGDIDGFHIFAHDVTARVEAEEVLRRAADELETKVAERTAELNAEIATRARVEAALRQSQKMEAIGQLTGGIAHDFNNMLTGVIGSLDIVRMRLNGGQADGIAEFVQLALASANRAASLTQRLLAFSRRQSLDSKPIDINQLVDSLGDLLRRTMGERISVVLELDAALPAGIADASELESAILNLAINARDAMPDGGRLCVSTRVVVADAPARPDKPALKPGRYIVISVSDSGVGMTPELLDKVFEPFFTTKPLGQGTGLGLSMVYGFAQQSGGEVRIDSTPGAGTTVSLFLPATEDAAESAEKPPAGIDRNGDGQCVLLVEDDEAVRTLVKVVLEQLGYVAIEASEALVAIPVLASARRIDLMISDVGLPGMNGRELAEVARKHRPDLPILFATGYAENAAIRASFLGSNMAMITKPFTIELLAAKIGEMLGGGRGKNLEE